MTFRVACELFCSARRVSRACWLLARLFVLLMALALACAPATNAAWARERSHSTGGSASRVLVLVLPGAALDQLYAPDLPALAGIARGSAAAWIAGPEPISPPVDRMTVVAAPIRHDPARPFGRMADMAALRQVATHAWGSRDGLWIDPGDLERAEQYAGLCLPAKAREHRRAALRGADHLMEALLHEPRLRDVWILAPATAPGPGLTPVFWWRRGSQPGFLRSGSTHMSGVVTGADVTASLVGLVGAPYRGDGRRLTVVPTARLHTVTATDPSRAMDPLNELRRLDDLAERTDRIRSCANRLIQWVLLAIVIAGIVALRTGRRLPQAAALAPLLLPGLLLAEGAWWSGSRLQAAGMLSVLLAGLIFGSDRSRVVVAWRRWLAIQLPARWIPLATATSVVCALALVTGNPFRWAVLSYSIRLGARFYGIGNEFMGWWLGAALLSVGLPASSRSRVWAVGVLLAVAVLIGHPSLGAKVGGAVTALAAVGVEAWPALRRRPALFAGALGAAAAALLGAAAWDASRAAGAQTHLGHLAARIAAEGPHPLYSLAGRKLLTELRVSLGLWGVLVVAGVWLILEARRRSPLAVATLAVMRLLPVAGVMLVVNDSGVIAAALMLSYGVLAAGETDARG